MIKVLNLVAVVVRSKNIQRNLSMDVGCSDNLCLAFFLSAYPVLFGSIINDFCENKL
jgi:hypothetical protein